MFLKTIVCVVIFLSALVKARQLLDIRETEGIYDDDNIVEINATTEHILVFQNTLVSKII